MTAIDGDGPLRRLTLVATRWNPQPNGLVLRRVRLGGAALKKRRARSVGWRNLPLDGPGWRIKARLIAMAQHLMTVDRPRELIAVINRGRWAAVACLRPS
jgi:hypothetical protein